MALATCHWTHLQILPPSLMSRFDVTGGQMTNKKTFPQKLILPFFPMFLRWDKEGKCAEKGMFAAIKLANVGDENGKKSVEFKISSYACFSGEILEEIQWDKRARHS